MKILHIIRHIRDDRALGIAQAQRRGGHQVTLLLLHDAVLSRVQHGGEVLACEDDVLARGGRTGLETVNYDEMARMIFEHDQVVSW